MDTPIRDKRVEIALRAWAPRFVASGVPLADFEEVTGGISRWDEWCAAWWRARRVHEEIGRQALADGYIISAAGHLTRAALCYHFGKFMFVHELEQMKGGAHENVRVPRSRAAASRSRRASASRFRMKVKTLYGILRKPAGVPTGAHFIKNNSRYRRRS